MATPVVESTAVSNESTSVTVHTVVMPSGIVSGDLVVIFWSTDGSSDVGWPTTDDGGLTWTQLWTDELESSGCNHGVRWRIADGTEGASRDFTTSTSEESAHMTFRISGHDSADPISAARSESTSADTAPDPPFHDPTGGADDFLWIASCGVDNRPAISAYPTNYTDGTRVASSPSGGASGTCILGTARRALNADSEDPGSFTLDAAQAWLAGAVAIRPAAAGTTISPAGLAQTRALGSPQVNTTLGPAGLDHGRTLGSPQVNPTLSPAGLARTRALGDITVTEGTTLSPAGLESTRALGALQVNPTLNPAGLVSTRALGAPNVILEVDPGSLTRVRALGSPQINPTVVVSALVQSRTLGGPSISGEGETASVIFTKNLHRYRIMKGR